MMFSELYTPHASIRKQQRGISDIMIDVVLEYGRSEYHHGKEIVYLDKRAFQKVCWVLEHSGKLSRHITNQLTGKLKKTYVVLQGGMVITTALKHHHFYRHRK